jgi:hypothetical protein
MSMRVRSLSVAGLALLTGASMFRAPISLALVPVGGIPNLRFTLPDVAVPERAQRAEPAVLATVGRKPHVARTYRVVETKTETIGFETLVHYSADMPLGTVRVVTPGSTGQALRTSEVTYRKGKAVERRLLSYILLTSPLPRVEIRGAPFAAPTVVHTRYGQASWYECSGMYAAHLSLPFGTVVTVKDLDNGKTVTVVINDRGPYGIAYRIIDLCFPAFAQIAPLAQGVARVEISW